MKKFITILIINIFLTSKSLALIEIDITRGNLDPLPIAISPLHVDIKSESYEGIKIKELGENISRIIGSPFRRCECRTRIVRKCTSEPCGP